MSKIIHGYRELAISDIIHLTLTVSKLKSKVYMQFAPLYITMIFTFTFVLALLMFIYRIRKRLMLKTKQSHIPLSLLPTI